VGIIDIWRFPKFGNVLGVVEWQVAKNAICISHALLGSRGMHQIIRYCREDHMHHTGLKLQR
jgi:hypothetical protein